MVCVSERIKNIGLYIGILAYKSRHIGTGTTNCILAGLDYRF